MLKETYAKCVKTEGSYGGKRIRDKDVIELKTGGTGFAARDGERVQTKKVCSTGEWRRLPRASVGVQLCSLRSPGVING